MMIVSKKICLLGDFAVGKTSLVRRFVYSLFDDKYTSIIGVKVSRKTLVVPMHDDMAEITMLIWDLAGSETFDQFRASYMRGAAGAVLVCDLGRRETLCALPGYLDQLRSVAPDAQCVVAANKSDVGERDVLSEEVEALADRLQMPCFLTSAKEDVNVEEMFRQLGRMLV